jgi:sugar lactone lactonase YvrE
VDPASGAQTTVSSGGVFAYPFGIALAPDGDILVVDRDAFPDASGGRGSVIRVDPTSGIQTVVSSGGNFRSPSGIVATTSGDIFVVDGSAFGSAGAIIRVNPVTGEQTTVSSAGDLGGPSGIALDANGDILVAGHLALTGRGAIIRVDSLTGAQTIVSSSDDFVDPIGIVVDGSGDIWMVDRSAFGGYGAVFKVDSLTGAHTTVSSGGFFGDPTGIALAGNGDILVTDNTGDGIPLTPDCLTGSPGGVIRVDPVTGAQTILSTCGSFYDPARIVIVPGTTNGPPVADAGPDQTVSAGPSCVAPEALNGTGSSDPDGDTLTFTWTGPFGTASGSTPTLTLPSGATSITLTVDDGHGGTASDTVLVTVIDTTRPTLTCSAPLVAMTSSQSGLCFATAAVSAVATDNCGSASTSCSLTSLSLSAPGTTTTSCTASDPSGNAASCSTSLTLIDDTPPTVSCTVGSGWAYTINAADNCGAARTTRGDTGGTVSSGTRVDPTLTNVALTAADPSGNPASAICPAPPLVTGTGRTIGFWASKRSTISLGDLAFLRSRNLKGYNGDDFDPVTVRSFQDWLSAANATNMAYMLSAQLAAMELNVRLLGQDPTQFLFTGTVYSACSVGFPQGLTIATLMSAANSDLGMAGHNLTLSGSQYRSCQEAMKNVLDDANGNKSIFVQ